MSWFTAWYDLLQAAVESRWSWFADILDLNLAVGSCSVVSTSTFVVLLGIFRSQLGTYRYNNDLTVSLTHCCAAVSVISRYLWDLQSKQQPWLIPNMCNTSDLLQRFLKWLGFLLGKVFWSITTTDSVALIDLLHSDGHRLPRAGLTVHQVRLAANAYMLPSVTDRQLTSLTSHRPCEAELGFPMQSVTPRDL